MAIDLQTLVEMRRQLHQIPEPGFEEFKTQALLLERIAQLPQDRIEVRTWRTGIFVHVKGTVGERRIGYRADMDGLPIEEDTSYPFRSTHPGFMHACGHDMHMTIGFGLLKAVVEQPLADHMLFIFQPAEEGPGGAEPMMATEEFKQWRPDLMIGLHIAPEYPVGTIATKPGILFANTSELFIELQGTGGHAAFPHKSNDMIIAGANLVSQLQTIISRNVDPMDSAVITIGRFEGGIRQNIIADKVRMEGTIRTMSPAAMEKVKARIEAVLAGVSASFDCKTSLDYGSMYHQVFNAPAETEKFMNWLAESGEANLVVSPAAMTGEDFGYFLEQVPGFMFWLGVDTPYGLHHAKIEPHENAIEVAVRVVEKYLREGLNN
jgi:N-acetyldiaminopimelate deacetylase